MVKPSILDDENALAAMSFTGYGILVLNPSDGATHSDEKIERMVIRMSEHLRDFGEEETANWPELICAATEFTARIVAASFALKAAPRSEHRKIAEHVAKNLKGRIMGACRDEGVGQERPEH